MITRTIKKLKALAGEVAGTFRDRGRTVKKRLRTISVFDPDARPIPKGKPKTPTEIGYKVVLRESEKRLTTDNDVFFENPPDEVSL